MTAKGGPRCGKPMRALITKNRPDVPLEDVAYCGRPVHETGPCRSKEAYEYLLARNRAYYYAGRRSDRDVKPR